MVESSIFIFLELKTSNPSLLVNSPRDGRNTNGFEISNSKNLKKEDSNIQTSDQKLF